MTGALLILVFLLAVGIVLYIHDRRTRGGEATPPVATAADVEAADEDEGCCGRHAVCEKTSLSPLTDKAEYYDDEELDRYAGRPADSYTPEEEEEFRDVLMTMRAEDVAGWSRSLQVRGIEPPVAVRDEILMIVGELRHPLELK